MLKAVTLLLLGLIVSTSADVTKPKMVISIPAEVRPVVLVSSTVVPIVEGMTGASTILIGTVTPIVTQGTTQAPPVILHEADHHHHMNDSDMEHNHTDHHPHEEAHHTNQIVPAHSSTVAVPLVTVKNTTTILTDLNNGGKVVAHKSETDVGTVNVPVNRNRRQWGYGGYGGLGFGGLGYGLGYGGYGLGYGGGLGGLGFGGPVIMDSVSITDIII